MCTYARQFSNAASSLADLYGRGYSDAPEITYDASLYATQLALLMQHVKWPKAYVAGVSMVRASPYAIVTIVDWFELFIQGGGILAAFTSFFPDLVDSKVMLIAPTGLVEVSSSTIYTACFRPHARPSPKTCQKQLNSCLRLSFNL